LFSLFFSFGAFWEALMNIVILPTGSRGENVYAGFGKGKQQRIQFAI